ncbi:MAG: hypothetical protein AABY15_04835 [Nanoarchaeota archaeon]
MDFKEIKKALEEHTIKPQPDRTILNAWKNERNQHIEVKEFNTAKELIALILKGLSPALIITGEGGIGKTHLTVEQIKANLKCEEWEYEAGYTTPLAFYKFLYAHRNKKLLILDDVEGLFNDRKGIGILKNAFWDTDGKRLVFYDTTSDKLNIPSVFQLNANLIVLCNKIENKEDLNVSALISRALCYEVNFTYEQKVEIMKRLIQQKGLTPAQQETILRLIEKGTTIATKNFNLRTLEKVISLVKYDPQQAEALFKEIVEIDEAVLAFLEISKNLTTEQVKIQQFKEKTGLSRATYFRLKKKYQSLIQNLHKTTTEGGNKNETRTATNTQL